MEVNGKYIPLPFIPSREGRGYSLKLGRKVSDPRMPESNSEFPAGRQKNRLGEPVLAKRTLFSGFPCPQLFSGMNLRSGSKSKSSLLLLQPLVPPVSDLGLRRSQTKPLACRRTFLFGNLGQRLNYRIPPSSAAHGYEDVGGAGFLPRLLGNDRRRGDS